MTAGIRPCCYRRCYRFGAGIPAAQELVTHRPTPGVLVPLASLETPFDVDQLALREVQTAG